MLTNEQKDKYINQDGVNCPYCGSRDIEGQSIEVDAGGAFQDISCLRCNREWTDCYKLDGIKEN